MWFNYGVCKFRDFWYKGDVQYGDGVEFYFDYYNSFVIYFMFIDVLVVMQKYWMLESEFLNVQ